MFWSRKPKKDTTEARTPPKFSRGDKVVDIYGGPEMYVETPRKLIIHGVPGYMSASESVRCVLWSGLDMKIFTYNEEELKLSHGAHLP